MKEYGLSKASIYRYLDRSGALKLLNLCDFIAVKGQRNTILKQNVNYALSLKLYFYCLSDVLLL